MTTWPWASAGGPGSGSASIFLLAGDVRLHVGWDGTHWWAVGHEGSYGGSTDRVTAIRLAVDAAKFSHWPGPNLRTIPRGERRIVVERPDGSVDFTITRVRGPAPSQVDHDSVP
jgi:hypothetical protein